MSKKSEREAQTQHDTDIVIGLRGRCLPFIQMLVPHRDLKEAKALVKEKAEGEWIGAFGAERSQLDLDVDDVDTRCAREADALAECAKQDLATKPYVKVASAEGSATLNETTFRHWSLKDQVMAIFCLVAVVLVMGAGMTNIYTNILASGSVVFLERPWLAVMISLLLPVSCSVSKFFADMIETDRAHRRYTRTVFSLTLVVSLVWIILFAQVYEGPAATMDLEAFGETNHIAGWLTGCQLLLEALAGSALFLMLGDIHAKYAPASYGRNTEKIMLEEIMAARMPHYEAARQARNETRARLIELQAMRTTFVTDMVALYLSLRRRFEDSAPQ